MGWLDSILRKPAPPPEPFDYERLCRWEFHPRNPRAHVHRLGQCAECCTPWPCAVAYDASNAWDIL